MKPSGDKSEMLDYYLKRVLIQNLRLPGLRMPQLELPLGGMTCALLANQLRAATAIMLDEATASRPVQHGAGLAHGD